MRKVALYILFILVYCSSSKAQTFSNVDLQRLKSIPWTGKAGISSNNITSVKQTSDKFIWLTTYSGIIKFDGFKSETFDKSNLDILTANGFSQVIEASDSTLYFATQVDGLIVYKNGVFSKLTASYGKVPDYVSSVVAEESGTLWLSSNTEGLFQYRNDSIVKIYSPKLNNANIHFIHLGDNGSLYICTEGEGLFVMSKNRSIKQYNTSNGLISNVTYHIAEGNDSYFLATQNGVFQLKDDKLTQLNYKINEGINFVKVDGNQLWLGSDNGLGRYNLSTKHFEYVTKYSNTDLSRINWIEFDHEGSIWMGTGRDGLIQLRYNGIINYSQNDGLTSTKINIVKAGIDNDFFVGCDNGSLYHLKDQRLTPIKLINDPAPTGIRDIHQMEDGSLWVLSYQGLVIKKGNNERTLNLKDGLSSLDLRVIFVDSKDRVWIATRTGGLIRIINEKVDRIFNLDSGFPSSFILSIEEDSNHNIILGTHSGGLVKIKEDDTFQIINSSKNNLGTVIFNTHLDSKNRLWVISNIGVALNSADQFKEIIFDKAPSNITFFDMLEDNNDGKWITSTQGIVHIDQNEIEKFVIDDAYRVKYSIINASDGMAAAECTAATRSIKDSNGNFYIPTINGIAYVNPEEIKRNNHIPEVYITSLTADDQQFYDGEIIPAGKTRYSIEFTACSFIAPEQVGFKYQLIGIDPTPVYTQHARHVEYTNLPPGKYTFAVFGSNNDGLWNEEEVTLTFEVAAFYYQTTWFYIVLFLGLMAFLYSIYLWRIKGIQKMNLKLRKVNSELDSFVYSASHDLRSPLASILGLIMLARKDKENVESYLDKIQLSVNKLDEFIGEIIEFSSNERKEIIKEVIDFKSIVTKVLEDLYYLNESQKINVSIKINDKGNFVSDPRRISVVLRNLISNALKYSDLTKDQSLVTINIETNAANATIEVIDNGIGIKQTDLKQISKMFYRATENSTGSGLGLYIVNEIVEKLDGTLNVESDYALGSTFTVTLPTLCDKS